MKPMTPHELAMRIIAETRMRMECADIRGKPALELGAIPDTIIGEDDSTSPIEIDPLLSEDK
jgi:hypothetical protein